MTAAQLAAIASAFLSYSANASDNASAEYVARIHDVDVDTVRAVMAGRSAGKEFAYRESRAGEPSYEISDRDSSVLPSLLRFHAGR